MIPDNFEIGLSKKAIAFVLISLILAILIWRFFLTNPNYEKRNDKGSSVKLITKTDNNTLPDKSPGLEQSLIRAKMSQLDKRIAELEKRGNKSDNDINSENKKEPSVSLEEITDKDEMKRIAIRTKREETIGRIFSSDKHDYEWETKMKTDINELMSTDNLASSTLVEMDCRSNMCKVIVSHKNEEARDLFSMEFGLKAPSSGRIWVRPFKDDVNGYGSEVYLTRQGHSVFTKADREAIESLK